MKKLGKKVTRTIFGTNSGFRRFNKSFTKLAASEPLSAEDLLLAQIMRGRDFTKGFQPATNDVKVANGQLVGSGLVRAMRALEAVAKSDALAVTFLAVYEGTVTREMLVRALKLVPSSSTIALNLKLGNSIEAYKNNAVVLKVPAEKVAVERKTNA